MSDLAASVPPITLWQELLPAAQRELLRRPAQKDDAARVAAAREIIAEVRANGDTALFAYAKRFDKVDLASLAVSPEEFATAAGRLTDIQRNAIDRAIANVRAFHAAQRGKPLVLETSPGVVCERHEVPLRAVGLYVPAGSAPLPSAAIMLAVPAELAGCPVRVLCTPPRPDGAADPGVLYAASRCGVTQVFKAGGAQAVAAMAYGTDTIPKVDKIFGPGNAWVTAAKMLVAQDPEGAAFDLPAGPSEVLVIADDTARADFVAADLLAQAEHDPSSQVVLLTPSAPLAAAVRVELALQLAQLSRREVTAQALVCSRLVVVPDVATAFAVSNDYAPEHLIVQVAEPRRWLSEVRTAGSVFLGQWTPEPMGDYCSGTNHVLPTYGYARAYSGLSLGDFVRRMTVQEITPAGLRDLGPVARTLAELEGLDAHANAVTIRLNALERGT
jgi:histidinol dehydrogenase